MRDEHAERLVGRPVAEVAERFAVAPAVEPALDERDDEGARRQAYDIFVRGGLGLDAAIGKPLFRRVRSEELDLAVEGLVSGWVEDRRDTESFAAFATRLSDEELGVLAGLEPARKREREEEAA